MFRPPSSRLSVRKKRCCKRSIIKPTLNSTAEKIRKKNVKESKFRLSETRPTKSTIVYKVIQSNSAVKSRCRDVEILINKLDNSRKKKIIKTFKSPKTISN